MIWHRKARKWTATESARATRMAVEIGCIFCWLDEGNRGPCDDRHHIKSGNKRMGHWYTLPCCKKHHDDCHNGTFGHAVQIDRWLKVQHILGLDDELPPTKILPRAVSGNNDVKRMPHEQDPRVVADLAHQAPGAQASEGMGDGAAHLVGPLA